MISTSGIPDNCLRNPSRINGSSSAITTRNFCIRSNRRARLSQAIRKQDADLSSPFLARAQRNLRTTRVHTFETFAGGPQAAAEVQPLAVLGRDSDSVIGNGQYQPIVASRAANDERS